MLEFSDIEKYLSKNAIKTYKGVLKNLDIEIALKEPNLILSMQKEKQEKIIKGLKFISKICIEKNLIPKENINMDNFNELSINQLNDNDDIVSISTNIEISPLEEEVFFLRNLVTEMIPHLNHEAQIRISLLFFERLNKKMKMI